jgi:hypothetical protein
MTPPVLLFILRLREAFTKIDSVPSFDEAFFQCAPPRRRFSLANCYIVTLDAPMIGVMGFVRSQRRWGAWAGLFALVLQLVLSFGHMHPDDLGLPPPAAAGHAQAIANTASAPIGQPQQDHQPQPDDYCAICASMALVATAIASLPPALIVPSAFRYIWPLHLVARGIRATLIPSFQARGPPSA